MNTASTTLQLESAPSPIAALLGNALALLFGPVGWLFGLIGIAYSIGAMQAQKAGDEVRAKRYMMSATTTARFALYGSILFFGVGGLLTAFVMLQR